MPFHRAAVVGHARGGSGGYGGVAYYKVLRGTLCLGLRRTFVNSVSCSCECSWDLDFEGLSPRSALGVRSTGGFFVGVACM